MITCTGRAMAQGFTRQPVTRETRVRSRDTLCGTHGGEIALGHVFVRVLRFSVVSIDLPVLHTHISCVYSRRCLLLTGLSTVNCGKYNTSRSNNYVCLLVTLVQGWLFSLHPSAIGILVMSLRVPCYEPVVVIHSHAFILLPIDSRLST